MRRLAAVGLAMSILAGACSSTAKHESGPTTTRSTGTTTTSTTSTTGMPCAFDPAPAEGQITWVDGGRLIAYGIETQQQTCLASGLGTGLSVQWSGDTKKALIDNVVLTAAGRQQEFAKALGLVLSRPTGRSVLAVGGEKIDKFEAGSTTAADITFVTQPHDVLYHPAGRSIIAVGTLNGHPVVKMATNRGANPTTIAVGETASAIHDLAFTFSNALLFVGDHGSSAHLHRLELATGKLTTVATADSIQRVTASPFSSRGVAWTTGRDCALVVEQNGKFISVKDTPVARAEPVGWLPAGWLVARTGCDAATGDVYVVPPDGAPRLVAHDVGTVAVRAVLPTPDEAPASIPDQAPA